MTDEDFQQLDVIKRLLDGKETKLEEIDQNVLSLCTLETIEHEIEESDKVSAKVVECHTRCGTETQRKDEQSEYNNCLIRDRLLIELRVESEFELSLS